MNQLSRDKRAEAGPSGVSFRQLRRVVNCGWVPQQPTEKAKLRHPWYQKKLAWDRLRREMIGE